MTSPTPSIPAPSATARDAVRALPRGQFTGPAGWYPLGSPEMGLWLGPGLAVAQRSPRGRWRIAERAEAHSLIQTHACAASPEASAALDRLATELPLGTPIAEAVATVRRALPGWAVIAQPDRSATLFIRPGDAVLCVKAGKYGELDGMWWLTGDDALATYMAYADRLPLARSDDYLVIALQPDERRMRRAALALGGVTLVAGPLVAAPLLLVDAVLALIGVAVFWTVVIALAPALLRRWAEHATRDVIRLDPAGLWLPAALGPAVTARAALTFSLTRRAQFGVATTSIAGRAPSARNPAMTYLTLNAPGLDLTLGCAGEPPLDRAVPLAPKGWQATRFAEVSRSDFRRLVDALSGRAER